MKIKLGFLATIALAGVPCLTLVSCANTNQKNQPKDLNQVVKVKNLGFIKYDIDSDDKEELNKAILIAVNQKNPDSHLILNDLDFNLVYENKTGDF